MKVKLLLYCIYTGASAILQDARNGNTEANSKIQTFIRALQSGTKRCPLLERSLNIILKGLNSSIDQNPSPGRMPIFDDTTAIHTYIPAFPYFGFSGVGDFEISGNPGGMSIDTFSALDCFPEVHMGAFVGGHVSPEFSQSAMPHPHHML